MKKQEKRDKLVKEYNKFMRDTVKSKIEKYE